MIRIHTRPNQTSASGVGELAELVSPEETRLEYRGGDAVAQRLTPWFHLLAQMIVDIFGEMLEILLLFWNFLLQFEMTWKQMFEGAVKVNNLLNEKWILLF